MEINNKLMNYQNIIFIFTHFRTRYKHVKTYFTVTHVFSRNYSPLLLRKLHSYHKNPITHIYLSNILRALQTLYETRLFIEPVTNIIKSLVYYFLIG